MPHLTSDQCERFSAALVRLDGDQGTLALLAGMVVEDAPIMLKQLESDVTSADFEAAAATGHALKGLLSTFETGTPVDDLQLMIDAAREKEAAATITLFASIKPALEKLVEEVRGLSQQES